MWSSARKTRSLSTYVPPFPATRAVGYAHEEGRAGAGRRLDVDRPAEQCRALAHPEQAEAARPRRYRRLNVEPAAIVLHDHEDMVAASLKDEAHAVGPRVLGDVRQRLLCDAVDGRLVRERET